LLEHTIEDGMRLVEVGRGYSGGQRQATESNGEQCEKGF